MTVVWRNARDLTPACAHAEARDLLGIEVATLLDVQPGDVSIAAVCSRCGGPHGRPVVQVAVLSDRIPFVSISRRSGVIVVAVSSDGPVGVDAERVGAATSDIAGVVLHPSERADDAEALTTTWVRKEALLKATGHGLTADPAGIVLSAPGDEPGLVRWDDPGAPTQQVWMSDLHLTDGYVACVAVLSGTRPDVTVRQASGVPAASRRRATP